MSVIQIDFYSTVGVALELLSESKYHREQPMHHYIGCEIMPPLLKGQVKVYLDVNDRPVGIVTWAWLSSDVQREIHATGRCLEENEWDCGDNLFFNDWITPLGNARHITKDMTHNVFPDQIATSLRRNGDGSVRRINRWTGINIRSRNRKGI
ncbi:MAG: toxin-activating lysine-acyltransferase [Dinoroseobacter sp.]|nr:toxin-activating lysine-acyltransferase [Dinoroseobacter sp.]